MKAFLGDIVGLLAILVVVESSDDVRFSIDQPLELHEESSHVACFCVNLSYTGWLCCLLAWKLHADLVVGEV